MVTIRATTRDDLAAIVALETAADTVEWIGETGFAWHERALVDPDQEHLVTHDGSGLTGFFVLANLRDDQRAVELRRMVLGASRRGAGHGRALLRAALTRAYDHHSARSVWLDVKPRNVRARTLYESEGFRVTQTLPGTPTGDGAIMNLLVMSHHRS